MAVSWEGKLKPDQIPARDHVLDTPGTLMLSEVGTGKTYVTVDVIDQLQCQYVLIIAPLTSLDITWHPLLSGLSGYVVCRTYQAFKAQIAQGRKDKATDKHLILLLHYQAAYPIRKSLGKRPWDLVVIDEAHGLKARGSGWSRLGRSLRHAKKRLALTATPLDESPIDLFGIMRFVDHEVLGEDFGDFASEFCVKGGFRRFKWIFRQSLLPKLLSRVKANVFRLTKDFLNLPPLTVYLVPTDMLGQQARWYEEMNEHGIVQLDTGPIVGRLAITKQGKLEQMTGGTVKDDLGVVHVIGHAKERKLNALLRHIGNPLVVFCKYLSELDLISNVLIQRFDTVRELHGGVKGVFRTNLINDFQAGKIDALSCQLRTGGVSISFTRASHLVFYSMNFSLIDFEQIIGRFHRGGQTNPVSVWIIYAKNSVDEVIIDDIKQKHSTFYEVVDFFNKENTHG
jgi:SNF2 family DNA or RNA helicase